MIIELFLTIAANCQNYVHSGVASLGLFPLAATHFGLPTFFFPHKGVPFRKHVSWPQQNILQ